jgi:hypothetical protein
MAVSLVCEAKRSYCKGELLGFNSIGNAGTPEPRLSDETEGLGGCESARVFAFGSSVYNASNAPQLHVSQVRPSGLHKLDRDHENGHVRLLRYKEGNMISHDSGFLQEAPDGGQGHGGAWGCPSAGPRDGDGLRLAKISWRLQFELCLQVGMCSHQCVRRCKHQGVTD